MSSTNLGGGSKRRKIEAFNFTSQSLSHPSQSQPRSQPSHLSSQLDHNSKIYSQGTGAAGYLKATDRILVLFIHIAFYFYFILFYFIARNSSL